MPAIGIGISPHFQNKKFSFAQYWATHIMPDGHTLAWYDVGDGSATYLTKDGSNFVSVWKDLSGNGNDLAQPSGANQPLYQIDGILTDGIDNYMSKESLTQNQPYFIYGVFKQITWQYLDILLSGIPRGFVRQQRATGGSSPYISIDATSVACENNNLTVDTFAIVRILFNGVNSKIQINNTTATTGNPGTANSTGIILGTYEGLLRFGNAKYKELIFRSGADDAATQTAIYNYLANKYGFVTI